MKQRKFWGWGWEGEGPTAEEQTKLGALLAERFGLDEVVADEPPHIDSIVLRTPRVAAPPALRSRVTADPLERAGHTYGKSFRDVARALTRDFSVAPDLVALPTSEGELVDILDWCSTDAIAVLPYGGGSSVVGGTEARVGDHYRGAISLDLRHFDQILEVDRESRAARIQAGIFGPALEEGLRPHGLTLRHFPQSFEFSTLGGWIATRSGGHYATLYTHIDDFVESLRVVTTGGKIATRRLPGSGAGPSPDRMFIGSEGTLGVITEAWMRLQDRPRYRNATSATFASFDAAVACVRAIAQAGLYPANCRLLDAREAQTAGAGDGSRHVLLLAFESADHGLDAWMARAIECVRDHAGVVPPGAGATREQVAGDRSGSAGAWRQSFLGAPYLRDALVALGMIVETFETAVTWDRFAAFHQGVSRAVEQALEQVCGGGSVTCRFTHVYPDGPAPYYSVIAPGRRGALVRQWDEIKAAAAEAILRHGGTITHHHAVGRDHRPWYDGQRPEPFAAALRSAKSSLDPSAILNPGVLIDPIHPARTR